MAEQFARIIASNELSTDDVDGILLEHSRSVHLLRIRQGDERRRLLERLDAKRHARRTADDHEKVDDHHHSQTVCV